MAAALHVTNGDCTDAQGTGLVERILVWFDLLHEGPVPEIGDLAAVDAATRSAADGDRRAHRVFMAAAGREFRPYLGDTWCVTRMDRLARAPVALSAEPARSPVTADTLLGLTDTGAHVLADRADHVELNGIDRWIGGVHLLATTPCGAPRRESRLSLNSPGTPTAPGVEIDG